MCNDVRIMTADGPLAPIPGTNLRGWNRGGIVKFRTECGHEYAMPEAHAAALAQWLRPVAGACGAMVAMEELAPVPEATESDVLGTVWIVCREESEYGGPDKPFLAFATEAEAKAFVAADTDLHPYDGRLMIVSATRAAFQKFGGAA